MKTTRKTKSKGSTKRTGRRAEPVKSPKQVVPKAARKRVGKKAGTDGRMPSLLGVAQAFEPVGSGSRSGRLEPERSGDRQPKAARRVSHANQSLRHTALRAFNPSLPVDGSLIIAGELRDQFNGLVVMIESIPAGPPGPQGVQGIQGPQGVAGQPFATAVVDGVTTLSPGQQAWVSSSFDGTDVHLTFGIPEGYQGEQGQQGEPGPQGLPGEVTNAQLSTAIATTAVNPSNIQPLNITISDPPTQGEVQQILSRMNDLISALYRAP
jgi:hypothetical protein